MTDNMGMPATGQDEGTFRGFVCEEQVQLSLSSLRLYVGIPHTVPENAHVHAVHAPEAVRVRGPAEPTPQSFPCSLLPSLPATYGESPIRPHLEAFLELNLPSTPHIPIILSPILSSHSVIGHCLTPLGSWLVSVSLWKDILGWWQALSCLQC